MGSIRSILPVIPVVMFFGSSGCINMPGDKGEPCNKHLLCASGLVCNQETKTCEVRQKCKEGDKKQCGQTDLGECSYGVQTCTGGTWGECKGAVLPVKEICDGKDNDCNGTPDDNNAASSCQAPADECLNGICHESSSVSCGYFIGDKEAGRTTEMCKIEAGTYYIGQDPKPMNLNEAVFIDRFEVTNLRYKKFFEEKGKTASLLPDCTPDYPKTPPYRDWNTEAPYFDADLGQHPVICISRAQAESFCAWAGKRLPTELEWEAAARGKGQAGKRIYPWGDEDPSGQANCKDISCKDTYPKGTCNNMVDGRLCKDTSPEVTSGATPEPVLESGHSPYDLLNMAGNAAEWAINPENQELGVLRGGSWDDMADSIHVYDRQEKPITTANATTGFRCAYSPVK
ncbi:MAG: formylglycine-generating enzyme family protein [Deltaproteobacteria bacterium]|nr:formylglycine-generating enzyme family protein [Deltaproteobacteria bacterium]